MSSNSPKVRNWIWVLVAAALLGAYLRPKNDDEAVYLAALRKESPTQPVELFAETDPWAVPRNDPSRPNESKRQAVGYKYSMQQLRPQAETQQSYEAANRSPRTIPRFKDHDIHVLNGGEGSATACWVSAVGFNQARTQALVSVNFQWSTADYLLEKDQAGKWTVVKDCSGRGGMSLNN